MRALVATAVGALALLGVSPCWAEDPDPWWGADKAMHFGFSAAIAAGGYTVGTAAFDARYEALLLGGGAALAAGTAKELADMAGMGNPSWRDFTWDVIGTVVGLGVAWSVDLAARGTSTQPALGRVQPSLRSAVVLSF